MIYGTVLCVVNLTLYKMMNSLTGYGEALIVFSVVSFWATMYLFNFFEWSHELYGLFWQVVSLPNAWIGMIFCSLWIFAIDNILIVIAKWYKTGSASRVFDSEFEGDRTKNYLAGDFSAVKSSGSLDDALNGSQTVKKGEMEMSNMASQFSNNKQSGYAFSEMERKPTIVNKMNN